MKRLLPVIVFSVMSLAASADEGMWLIQQINSALEKKMQERGLELSANEIYNADAPGTTISDAVVSLGFYCTASIVSDEGLLITNHHCAFSDLADMSTPEDNILQNGYTAILRKDEIPVKGKEVFFLKKIIDVTQEYQALEKEFLSQGKPASFRKLSYLIETKYNKITGYESSLASMWSGLKYYLSVYEVYRDVRLVCAPPQQVAAFGGDVDNWEWPQHKCDFTMYRVYASEDGKPAEYSEKNVPLKGKTRLQISAEGYSKGDFAMVIGFPGRTNRYASSFETDYTSEKKLPLSNAYGRGKMEIISKWMNADSSVRMKYSDSYFNLTNVGELNEGEVECLRRFRTADKLRRFETRMPSTLLDSLKAAYAQMEVNDRNRMIYQESWVRGTGLYSALQRIKNARSASMAKHNLQRMLETLDMRVEKELFEYACQQYFANIDPSFMGEFHTELSEKYGKDGKAIARALWEESSIPSLSDTASFGGWASLENDPLWRAFDDVSMGEINKKLGSIDKNRELNGMHMRYTFLKYSLCSADGIPQYPNANSTMRITYGVVRDMSPKDGVLTSWYTTPQGIVEKHDASNFDFDYGEQRLSLHKAHDWGRWAGKDGIMKVDFLTDNDITGGNSGSPVLNSKGQVIGLAFDGNKESLASDIDYTQDYNMCVNVDIRYVLWYVDKVAHLDRVISELGF